MFLNSYKYCGQYKLCFLRMLWTIQLVISWFESITTTPTTNWLFLYLLWVKAKLIFFLKYLTKPLWVVWQWHVPSSWNVSSWKRRGNVSKTEQGRNVLFVEIKSTGHQWYCILNINMYVKLSSLYVCICNAVCLLHSEF